MKKTYLYMIGCAAALMMVGCAKDATVDNGGAVKAHSVSINAHVADEVSRLILDEEVDGVRWPIWEVGDQAALVDEMGAVRALTIDESITGPGQEGYTIFNGEAVVDFSKSAYPIVYPFDVVESVSGDVINIDLPDTQVGTTGADWLMTGYTYTGDMSLGVDVTIVDLFNVVGFLELQVVGEGTVSSITVQSESQKLSGAASLQMSYEGPATLTVTGNNFVSLVPAEEVALNASTPTSFFVALPAGTYPAGDLSVVFETSNGVKGCVSSAEHVLEVSHVKPLALSTASSSIEYIDLTAGDKYANTFIVEEEGWYKFAAKTRGGFTEVAHPKTGDVILTLGGENADAACAWETTDGMITNVNYDVVANEISFYYNGVKGNAMICLMENNLSEWNWHIWCTDKPADQTVGQNDYMDRNLGAWAIPANVEDGHNYLNRDYDDGKGNIQAVLGLMYQWGRPIPFPQAGRIHARFISNATDTSHSVYQREPENANTCADLWVESTNSLASGTTAEDMLMGYTQKFYFPGGDLVNPIYCDRSNVAKYSEKTGKLVPWTNKWHGVNTTTNTPLATAINQPFRIYGTAAGSSNIGLKYWCKELFEDSFDFGSTHSPWNYGEGAQSNMVFDVCPHGYKVLDGEQALADFGSLNYTWRVRYNSGNTSSDGLTTGTTRTVAAYATATDGSLVWVPWTGGRVFYGGWADWDCINWWCSSNNSENAVVAWKQTTDTSKPHLINGVAKSFTSAGAASNANWETVISACFATRCQKIK